MWCTEALTNQNYFQGMCIDLKERNLLVSDKEASGIATSVLYVALVRSIIGHIFQVFPVTRLSCPQEHRTGLHLKKSYWCLYHICVSIQKTMLFSIHVLFNVFRFIKYANLLNESALLKECSLI